jgi:hypothetical protein
MDTRRKVSIKAIEEEYLDAAQASDLGHLGEAQAS